VSWKEKAIKYLKDSLYSIPIELNEIDWKSGLSPKSDRLAQHLCAFSNLPDGGFLVFGVNDDASMFSVTKEQTDTIVRALGNIALNNLSQSVQIQHNTIEYNGNYLLFVHIPGQTEKPVYLRGKTIFDSYHRSAGQTVKMSPQEVKQIISESQGLLFHEQIALTRVADDDVLRLLDYDCYFQLTRRSFPGSKQVILDMLVNEEFIVKQDDYWNITNLGALLFARDLAKFKGLQYKTIRACYQHCCLKYMEREKMTNQSFRVRMGINEENAAMVSRIIKETVNSGYIKGFNPESVSKKHAKYIPFWA